MRVDDCVSVDGFGVSAYAVFINRIFDPFSVRCVFWHALESVDPVGVGSNGCGFHLGTVSKEPYGDGRGADPVSIVLVVPYLPSVDIDRIGAAGFVRY